MKIFKKNRIRLLVLSQDEVILDNLATMLTGYDFYVDYLSSMKDGVRKFRAFRHPIVLVDERMIPPTSRRLFATFFKVQENCLILPMIHPENGERVGKYLEDGAYSSLNLPLNAREIHERLERLMLFYNTMTKLNYSKILFLNFVLILPILMGSFWYLGGLNVLPK